MNYAIEFIIVSIFASVTVGAFIGFVFVNTIIDDAEVITKWIIGIIIMLAIGCSLGGLVTLDDKKDDEYWNNGYCIKCDGSYKLTSVVSYKSGDNDYYYTCDECGYIIVLGNLKQN